MSAAGAGRAKRLLLFDIDGTLLSAGAQVRPLFAAALEEVFGTAGDLDAYDFAGKTDDQAVFEVMTAAGLEAAEIHGGLGAVRSSYLERLDRGLDGNRMRLLPGVLELLEGLVGRADLAVGLLTGNWERGARVKLGRLGLDGFFRFGAFGDGVTDRRRLPPVALERASRSTGRRFTAAEALVVGDTDRDVDCAHAHGIEALAVATGPHSYEALERTGAEWVYTDLAAARIDPSSPLS